jgi:hypothetical protein
MNISQDGQPLDGDLNLGCPNYDAEGITTWPQSLISERREL